MKITCDIVKDLLPLYAEDIASADSSTLVEGHLASCETCRKELERIRLPGDMPIDTHVLPPKKVWSALQKRKFLTIMLSVMLTLIVAVVAIFYISTPNYLPYSDDTMTVSGSSDGSLFVIFGDNVSGYDVNKYLSEDEPGYVYHFTAWNSILDRSITKNSIQNMSLNPNGENVISVYYYLTDGSEDILVYGVNQNPNGGVVTLPRLVLSYYVMIAFLLTVVCGLSLLLLRKNNKAKNIIWNISLLPISYLLAHFFIKRGMSSSYSAIRDFLAILLLTFPICAILNIIRRLLANKNVPR